LEESRQQALPSGKPNPFGGAAPRKVDPELEKKLDEKTAITPPPDRNATGPPRPKPNPFGGAAPIKTSYGELEKPPSAEEKAAADVAAAQVTEAAANLSVS